jgi:alkylhydroperoxidase family enzyme
MRSDPLEDVRAAAAAVGPAPPVMAGYLELVRSRAYAVTDADVEALITAGCTEDEVFEQTVAAAVAEGLRRLEAGLAVLP